MPDLLDIKTGLLEALRKKNGCSARHLTATLSCSREAIFSAITELNQQDYVIEETEKKWRLNFSPDIPFAFEFPGRQNRMHYFPEITSTMDEAREMARRGCPDLAVVVAGIQTKGRGRIDRIWSSNEGGLYFTVIIKPDVHPKDSIKFNFMASLALTEVLRQECRIDARVKWPNDIMVGEEKLSGMLSEMDARGDAINFVNIGIGINVNNDPSLIQPRAVSIKALTGGTVSRVKILRLFLDRFETELARNNLSDVIRQWKYYAGCLNREVTVVTFKEKLKGFAEGVDDQGALVLRMADGTTRTVCYGDCFYG